MNIQEIKIDNITIKIIRDLCIGAGPCTVYAPNTFEIDDEGLAYVKEGDWDKLEDIVLAAKSCPVFAIEVFEGDTKIWPKL